jgi:hypothetical protein
MRTYSYRLLIHLTGTDRATLAVQEVTHVNGTRLTGKVLHTAHIPVEDLWIGAAQKAASMINMAIERAHQLNPGLPYQAVLPADDAYDAPPGARREGTPPPE